MGARPRFSMRDINRRVAIENSWDRIKYDFNNAECQDKLAQWASDIKGKKTKCQLCGSNVKLLEAHHIFYKSFYPKLSLNLGNGMRLCPLCHRQVHGENLKIPTKIQKVIKLDLSRIIWKNGVARNVLL